MAGATPSCTVGDMQQACGTGVQNCTATGEYCCELTCQPITALTGDTLCGTDCTDCTAANMICCNVTGVIQCVDKTVEGNCGSCGVVCGDR
jgi:hypothetical protein